MHNLKMELKFIEQQQTAVNLLCDGQRMKLPLLRLN